MEKKYKYITVKSKPDYPSDYLVINAKSGEVIGCIDFYKPWRQYVFEGVVGAVFNNQCLRDIINFIDEHAGK